MVSTGVAGRMLQAPGWQVSAVKKTVDRGIREKHNNQTVVLIEPDASVRDALTVLLEGEGWKVRCVKGCLELRAASGKAA